MQAIVCYKGPMSLLSMLQSVFVHGGGSVIEDVDFSYKYLAFIIREGRNFRICSVTLPLSIEKVKS